MRYEFTKEELQKLKSTQVPEWVMTLGNGGYSSGTAWNSTYRHHHGYLITSKKPPINRELSLVNTTERLMIYSREYKTLSLNTTDVQYDGHQYLEHFSFDGVPTYTYAIEDVIIDKMIAPVYQSNTIAIHYEITNGRNPLKLAISPMINFRNHGDISNELSHHYQITQNENIVTIAQENNQLNLFYSLGKIDNRFAKTINHIIHEFDRSTGDDRLDSYAIPFEINLSLKPHEKMELSMIASVDEINVFDAFSVITDYRTRQLNLVKKAGYNDDFSNNLIISADQFISYRQSTNSSTILAGLPWFTDWGRDTMIAFTGLCLSTKRFEEAKTILKSFSLYEKNGLIPNMFPDDGQEPLYNTVDASLWYFQAINEYFKATNDFAFIHKELYPVMKKIITAYELGTDFSIRMDQDGLIQAGSGLDQVTWMDVRINGVVVTPRHGKPVEINALWYNALLIMAEFSLYGKEKPEHYLKLANQVKKSFKAKFINPKTKCLYDVVDPDDESIRPNQIYAMALEYPLLSKNEAKEALKVIESELLDIYGLRTLGKSDSRFKPVYEGPLEKRDFAYHMGTVWPFLLGGYIDAYLYAYESTDEALSYAKQLCLRFLKHMNEHNLNGIAEIFDGLNGQISRGCYTQAWSVGEILRVYTKYELNKVKMREENAN